MAYEYLKNLDFPGEIQNVLQRLGARTPGALLSMLEYSRDKFVRILGDEQTARLHDALLKIVPAEEREKLKDLPEFKPYMGAMLPPEVESAQNASARNQRDQLMDEIKSLRESDDQTPDKAKKLEGLEQQLRDVLKLTVAATRQ
ncbi:MAG: hypothetical protein LAP21_19785 [Acidobacteriia bacterium]|nr:hypothetical protein [Terriglobia bacterium]